MEGCRPVIVVCHQVIDNNEVEETQESPLCEKVSAQRGCTVEFGIECYDLNTSGKMHHFYQYLANHIHRLP